MKKITELTAIAAVAEGDLVAAVDVSDTSQAASGSTRKMTVAQTADYLKARTETLTNKTLTSPKINEDVAVTVKASELNSITSGWIPANETWTYASATTITVPTGAASRYQKGMPFKLTANSVVLQGYIVGVADTVLTVVGNALTNHTFTNNYYGQSGTSPLGFPTSFSYTPTYGGGGSMTVSRTGATAEKFHIIGNQVHFCLQKVQVTTGGTANLFLTATLPVLPAGQGTGGGCWIYDNTGGRYYSGNYYQESGANQIIRIYRYDAASWQLSASTYFSINGFYEY